LQRVEPFLRLFSLLRVEVAAAAVAVVRVDIRNNLVEAFQYLQHILSL
jgi:hypothetical protein